MGNSSTNDQEQCTTHSYFHYQLSSTNLVEDFAGDGPNAFSIGNQVNIDDFPLLSIGARSPEDTYLNHHQH
ncbi:hypothetical protein PTKIN_Ptkin16aG0039700 [Pterospermum kingtungense]